jgi:hypothetical protein
MKTQFILFIFLLICGSAFGQIRHVQGIKSVDGFFGISQFGNTAGLSFVSYSSSKLYWKVSLFNETGGDQGLTYNSTGLDFSYQYTPINFKEIVYFNAQLGLTASLDRLDKNEFYNVSNTMKYGFFGGVEIETFITDRWVFLLNANQRVLFSESFGRYRYFMSAGLRFNLK